MHQIVFFKAKKHGMDEVVSDMFGATEPTTALTEKKIRHKGYTDRKGAYHRPHEQTHRVKADGEKPAIAADDKKPPVSARAPMAKKDAAREMAESRQGEKTDFREMVAEASRWRGAALKAERIYGDNKKARLMHSHKTYKGDLDAYLMRKYGIKDHEARAISNTLTHENIPADESAKVEDYADEQWAKDALKYKQDSESPRQLLQVAVDHLEEDSRQKNLPAAEKKEDRELIDRLKAGLRGNSQASNTLKKSSLILFKAAPVDSTANNARTDAAPGSWVGVDLDGTLAYYEGFVGDNVIGVPIESMVDRVKSWLSAGIDVRIFTARADSDEAVSAINEWCRVHIGRTLPVTGTKDHGMVELWDDRAVRVETNSGCPELGMDSRLLKSKRDTTKLILFPIDGTRISGI